MSNALMPCVSKAAAERVEKVQPNTMKTEKSVIVAKPENR